MRVILPLTFFCSSSFAGTTSLQGRRLDAGSCSETPTVFQASMFVEATGIPGGSTEGEIAALEDAFVASYNQAAFCANELDFFELFNVNIVTDTVAMGANSSQDMFSNSTWLLNVEGECLGCASGTAALNVTDALRRILSDTGHLTKDSIVNEPPMMRGEVARMLDGQVDECCSPPFKTDVLTEFNSELDSLVTNGAVETVSEFQDLVLLEQVECSPSTVTFNGTTVIAAQVDLDNITTAQLDELALLVAETYNVLNLLAKETCDSTFRRIVNITMDVVPNAQLSARLQDLEGNPWYVQLIAQIEGECLGCDPEAQIFSLDSERLLLDPSLAANSVLDQTVENCLCAVGAVPDTPTLLEFEAALDAAVAESEAVTFILKIEAVYDASPLGCSNAGLSDFEMTIGIDFTTDVAGLTEKETSTLELALYQDYNSLNAFNSALCDTSGFPVVTDVVLDGSFATDMAEEDNTDCSAFPCEDTFVSVCRVTAVGANTLCIAQASVETDDSCGPCEATANSTISLRARYTGQCRGCSGTPILFEELGRRLDDTGSNCFCPFTAENRLPTEAEFVALANATFQTIIPDAMVAGAYHVLPSDSPTATASILPSIGPSDYPSISLSPSVPPSIGPSDYPSISPSDYLSVPPSIEPSNFPSLLPSWLPSVATSSPTRTPDNDLCVHARDIKRKEKLYDNTLFSRGVRHDVEANACQASSIPSIAGGVWFVAEGDERFWTLSTCSDATKFDAFITVFTGACDSLECVPSLTATPCPGNGWSVNLVSERGTTYYILVQSLDGSNGVFAIEFTSTRGSAAPSEETSGAPSDSGMPSLVPSVPPSSLPSGIPTEIPSGAPSVIPTDTPSENPSLAPSSAPSTVPTNMPSENPSLAPSSAPSTIPTDTPSENPSLAPSSAPSTVPTDMPSKNAPSSTPSIVPTDTPSENPSLAPSGAPSLAPSSSPSTVPSLAPSGAPKTVSYSFGAATIRDKQTTNHQMAVTENCPIEDTITAVTLTHTWMADLIINILHPDGTSVLLRDENGGSADFSNTTLTFDDTATNAASTAVSSSPATVYPDGIDDNPSSALSDFNDKDSGGTWVLQTIDDAGGDTGTLDGWTLTLTIAAC